jgi:hypothetical protein
MKRKYETKLYRDPTKLIIVLILSILMAIAILIYLGRLYDSTMLGFWLPMLIVISLFCFSSVVKKKFLEEKAILDFDDKTFSVTLYPLDTATILSQESFLWPEIEAYRVYFDTKTNTCLTLYLNGKGRRTFIFKDNKTFEEAIIQNSVFSNFYFCVKYLNQNGLNIKVRPSLLATKTGQMIISGEIGLIIFAVILHLITHSFSKSFYLIFAIVLIIPQVINRSQNKAVYQKMLELG